MSHLEATRLAELASGADPTDDEATHLFACAACAAACEPHGTTGALSLLRDAVFGPDPARLVAMEAALVQTIDTRRRRRRVALVAAPLVALAVAAAWLFVPRHGAVVPPPASHADVTAEAGATIKTAQSGGDEIVDLEGHARFSVRKLGPGERYRVRVRGDELEVRGTAFEIDADGEGFRSVVVTEGVVEVRPACCTATRLGAGDRWERPAAPASSAAVPSVAAPDAATAAVPAPAPTSALAPDVPGAELLARGTAAYDAGSYAVAADLLRRAVRAEPGAAWARDATVLAGAAAVLLAAPDAIPGVSASVASLDAAAKRAQRGGDAKRAVMAQLAAARRSTGASKRSRYCALQGASGLPPALRDEAARACSAP